MNQPIQLTFDAKQIMIDLLRHKEQTHKAERLAFQEGQRAYSQYERFVRICRLMFIVPFHFEFNEKTLEFTEPEQIQTRHFSSGTLTRVCPCGKGIDTDGDGNCAACAPKLRAPSGTPCE